MPEIKVAYTPDSDDAFNFYAWEHGRVSLDRNGYETSFYREHINALNVAAREGRYDVVAVSSVVYPSLADSYWVLASGNSIGRGWGPVLVAGDYATVDELRGKRVGVGGIPTTGSTLALRYCPQACLVSMPYDHIADSIARGEIDAGVMIHEELLYFPEKGLRLVCDLGVAWMEETGLPLPVGLNLVSRKLGLDLAQRVAATCYASLRWAQDHPDEAYAFASRFGRGCARKHVEMFSNEDTLVVPPDVRQAMRILFQQVAGMKIGPPIDSFRIIGPGPDSTGARQ